MSFGATSKFHFATFAAVLALALCPGPLLVEAQSGQSRGVDVATVKQLPNKQKRWALIIGVSQYKEDANFATLPGPDRDARALKEALVKYAGFPDDHVTVMTSDAADPKLRPTHDNIMETLTVIATTRVDKDGLFLFAFSGHGITTPAGEGVLAASDTRALASSTYLKRSGILVSDVQDIINDSGVKQRIFLLDACRNNPIPGSKGTGDSTLMTEGFQLDSKNSNVDAYVTLYATGINQVAWDNEQTRHGYFMEAVVEGLSGKVADPKTGEVALGRLIDYIENTVKERTLRDKKPTVQRPFHRDDGHLSQDLVLAFVPSARRELTAEEEWEKIRESTDMTVLKNYESKYPKSKYAEEAAWRTVRASKNWSDFKTYLSKYPQSVYAYEAQSRADKLLWEEVGRAKSLGGYQNYLKEYPSGDYAPLAVYQIEELSWQQALQSGDYKSYLGKYPEGRFARYARSLLQPVPMPAPSLSTPVLSVFTSPPVPNARVAILPKAAGGRPIEGQIDSTGAFSTELPAGVYDVEVTAAKYKSERKESLRVDKSGAVTIEMTPLTGSILIGPVEGTADVFLNGQKQTNFRAGDKRIEIPEVPAGHYTLRVVQKLESQVDVRFEREIDVSGGKPSSVFTEFKTTSTTGILSIGVNVPTALVVITSKTSGFRGEKHASTDLRFELLPGSYDVEVTAEKYKAVKKTVLINRGDLVPLAVNLEPDVVKVTIKGPVGASIYLDKALKGTITSTGELVLADIVPGSHTIEATLSGFKDSRVEKSFTANELLPIKMERTVYSAEITDEFRDLVNWDAPATWKAMPDGKPGVRVSGAERGFRKDTVYRDFDMYMTISLNSDRGAVWVLRARDKSNYYLFQLTPRQFTSYISKNGQTRRIGAAQTVPKNLLPASGEMFSVHVTASSSKISTFIKDRDGVEQPISVLPDTDESVYDGTIGFGTFDREDFTIRLLTVLPIPRQ